MCSNVRHSLLDCQKTVPPYPQFRNNWKPYFHNLANEQLFLTKRQIIQSLDECESPPSRSHAPPHFEIVTQS